MASSDLVENAPWRMLHPASAAVNLVPRSWAFVKSAWPVLLIVLFNGRNDVGGEQLADLAILGVFLLLMVGQTIIHFLTLRYRMVAGRLEIKSGLLNRQVRVLTPDKIQNVEMVRNVFHRLSGLVEVRVETASGTEVEGMLSALSVEDADELIRSLQPAADPVDDEEERPEDVVMSSPWVDLVKFGATSSRSGATLVVLAVLYEAMIAIDPQATIEGAVVVGWMGAAAIAFAVLVGTWLYGIGIAVVSHWGYRMIGVDDGLMAEEGLLTRRRIQLKIRKVQRVILSASWLRRLLGFGSVSIETAASGGPAGLQRAITVVPVVHDDEVDALVRRALPEADVPLGSEELRRPADRALHRAMIRGAIQGLIFGGLLAWWFWPMGAIAVVLVAVSVGLAWLDWRYQRWLVTDKVVLSRVGFLSRTTTIVARDKLQSVELDQGPLLRRYGLASVVVRVAGGGVRMPLITYDEAFELVGQLSLRAGATVAKSVEPVEEPTPRYIVEPSLDDESSARVLIRDTTVDEDDTDEVTVIGASAFIEHARDVLRRDSES